MTEQTHSEEDSRPVLTVNFTDFWPTFQKEDNYFYDLLSTKYRVVIDEQRPLLLFYSCFGRTHSRYQDKSLIKIFYTGENRRPDFNECDFAFSFDYLEDNRNYRLPLWVLYIDWFDKPYNEGRRPSDLISRRDLLNRQSASPKTKFCAFVYSNETELRRYLFTELSKYKTVDSAGGFLNNVGFRLKAGRGNKVDFISSYKFTCAFENSRYPGYTTEKILQPLAVSSIPIYWGSPEINRDFNERAFLNVLNYPSAESLIRDIIRYDNSDALYQSMTTEPVFVENRFPEFCLPATVLSYIENHILRGV